MTIDTQRLATDPDYWRECGAPEDAEFYGPGIKDWAECWYKKDPDWSAYLGGGWNEFGYDEELLGAFFQQRLSTLIPRPKTASEEWVDGLPPIGCECEGDADTRPWGYEPCLLVYHDPSPKKFEHSSLALFKNKHDGRYTEAEWCSEFRPIRTKQERQRGELADLLFNYGLAKHDAVPAADAIIADGWTKP